MPKQPGVEAPETWSVYLATDDAQKTLEAATAHGGQIVLPAMAVADLGTMAMVADAGGAAIGLWQPGLHKGFGVFGETGTPAWFEVYTRDYPATVAFYRDVFGWDTQTVGDTPEFRYTVMQHGEEQLAGIMDASGFLPEGVPAHWSVYFGTEDTDATPGHDHQPGGLGHHARGGHPVRPAGRGGRPDGRPLQAGRLPTRRCPHASPEPAPGPPHYGGDWRLGGGANPRLAKSRRGSGCPPSTRLSHDVSRG